MKKFFYVIMFFILTSITIAFVISYNKKEKVEEVIYSELVNYNFLYQEERTFEINIFSNYKDSDYLYLDFNEYYLIDYHEDFYMPLNVINIKTKKSNKGFYKHTIKSLIPSVGYEYYLDKAYIKIINSNKEYMGLIGSYYVNELYDVEYLSVEKLSGEFDYIEDVLTLKKINISLKKFDITKYDKKNTSNISYNINISNDDNYTNIELTLNDYKYYLNTIFITIVLNDKTYVLDNFIYGINEHEYDEIYNQLSLWSIKKND